MESEENILRPSVVPDSAVPALKVAGALGLAAFASLRPNDTTTEDALASRVEVEDAGRECSMDQQNTSFSDDSRLASTDASSSEDLRLPASTKPAGCSQRLADSGSYCYTLHKVSSTTSYTLSGNPGNRTFTVDVTEAPSTSTSLVWNTKWEPGKDFKMPTVVEQSSHAEKSGWKPANQKDTELWASRAEALLKGKNSSKLEGYNLVVSHRDKANARAVLVFEPTEATAEFTHVKCVAESKDSALTVDVTTISKQPDVMARGGTP